MINVSYVAIRAVSSLAPGRFKKKQKNIFQI